MKIASFGHSIARAGVLLAALWVCAAHPQTPKVAITSLVGDTLTVTTYRERAGTHLQSNYTSSIKVPGPVLDHAVLKAAQEAVEKVRPGASVAALRVPTAGSDTDPAQLVVDGKPASGNVLIEALRQQGFTHLVTASKLRAPNRVKLADGEEVGTGQLEGLGFYIDPTIVVQRSSSAERHEGILAPHVYVQLTLIDLAAQQVQAVQKITASTVVAAARNQTGVDAWGAMSPDEKLRAIQRLILRQVSEAVPQLFEQK